MKNQNDPIAALIEAWKNKDATVDGPTRFHIKAANAMPAIVALVNENQRMKSMPLASEAVRAVVYGERIDQLLLEYERDVERLAWIEAQDDLTIDRYFSGPWRASTRANGGRHWGNWATFRAAIDAALAQQKEEST